MSERCQGRVYPRGLHVAGGFPCPNKAIFEHEGQPYCGIHNPPSVAERERIRLAKSLEKDGKRSSKRERHAGIRVAKDRVAEAVYYARFTGHDVWCGSDSETNVLHKALDDLRRLKGEG